MAHTLGFRLIAVVVLLATAVPWFASPTAGDAAEAPHWVNDLKYGSRGGGFYWDSGSGFVWTAERGWHTFSPVPARSVSPLWVNDLAYPSKGKGFYLDPGTNMVWTAECGWHHFNRDGCPDDGGGEGSSIVVISYVLYDSPISYEGSGEYVVLTNIGSYPANLTGWQLWDDKYLDGTGTGRIYTFPNFTLAAGASVTIHTCTGTNTATDRYNGSCRAVWNNEGDTAVLLDASGSIVDTYPY